VYNGALLLRVPFCIITALLVWNNCNMLIFESSSFVTAGDKFNLTGVWQKCVCFNICFFAVLSELLNFSLTWLFCQRRRSKTRGRYLWRTLRGQPMRKDWSRCLLAARMFACRKGRMAPVAGNNCHHVTFLWCGSFLVVQRFCSVCLVTVFLLNNISGNMSDRKLELYMWV